jgi:dCMP deaminase
MEQETMEPDSNRLHKMILGQCYRAAGKSPDLSTQIGAVIVTDGTIKSLTMAYNGFVDGWVPSFEDFQRPRKYQITEHAERRSIYKAAKYGIATEGGTLYSTWAACTECARSIVEAGIVQLVRHHPPDDEAVGRWLESVSLGDEIMKAGNVTITDIHGPIYDGFKILRDGETFDPAKS